MRIRTWFSKILIKYPYFPWVLGFLLPFLYIVFFLHIKKIINHSKKKDNVFVFLIGFLVVQLISIAFSPLYSFFDFGRLAAILHNLLGYSFVFLGYIFLNDKTLFDFTKNNILKMFYALALIIFLGAMWSYYIGGTSYFTSLPNLLGINSKFFNVIFSIPSWHFIPDFPRTTVMSIYPNATGLIILMVHTIYMNFHFSKPRNFQIFTFLIFILCIFTTGSRSFLVLSVFLFMVYLINTKGKLWILVLITPILIIIAFPLVDYMISGRQGSNEMRSLIYYNSFKFMIETNPIFGLGLKPLIPEVADKYPVGSHSTPWGYIIKCGLVGGGVILFFYLKVILKYILYLFKLVFSDTKLNHEKFYHYSSFFVILIASFFEDLDAFEIMPFYFGIILWQFYRMKKEYVY
jgi:hypothetical protein